MTGDKPSPFKELETVALVRDVPEAGLKVGDIGAVVQVYSRDVFEVEFITATRGTHALLTLRAKDLRTVGDDDLLVVRPVVRVGTVTQLDDLAR